MARAHPPQINVMPGTILYLVCATLLDSPKLRSFGNNLRMTNMKGLRTKGQESISSKGRSAYGRGGYSIIISYRELFILLHVKLVGPCLFCLPSPVLSQNPELIPDRFMYSKGN